jgi:hypothetical protein
MTSLETSGVVPSEYFPVASSCMVECMVRTFDAERIILTVMEVNCGVVVFEPHAVITGINATTVATARK